jgi:hypothetical protein
VSDLRWTRGGEATLVAMDGDMVKLVSTVPWPPGARLDAEVLATPGVTVRIKVHASRRREDGTFAIDGRAFDVTREVRAKLEALVDPSATGKRN